MTDKALNFCKPCKRALFKAAEKTKIKLAIKTIRGINEVRARKFKINRATMSKKINRRMPKRKNFLVKFLNRKYIL